MSTDREAGLNLVLEICRGAGVGVGTAVFGTSLAGTNEGDGSGAGVSPVIENKNLSTEGDVFAGDSTDMDAVITGVDVAAVKDSGISGFTPKPPLCVVSAC